jgi:hypothetical protein
MDQTVPLGSKQLLFKAQVGFNLQQMEEMAAKAVEPNQH